MTQGEIIATHGQRIEALVSDFNRCNDKSQAELNQYRARIVEQIQDVYNNPGKYAEKYSAAGLEVTEEKAVELALSSILNSAKTMEYVPCPGNTAKTMQSIMMLAVLGVVAWMLFSGGGEEDGDYGYMRWDR